LAQTVTQQGICWRPFDYPATIIGDIGWKDYRVSIDYFLPGEGSAKLWGRVQGFAWGRRPYTGYGIEVDHSGNWTLRAGEKTLVSGKAAAGSGAWRHLSLSMKGEQLSASLDSNRLAMVNDGSVKSGLVALGTGWNRALFGNLNIEGAED
jgi:hypothetical protein